MEKGATRDLTFITSPFSLQKTGQHCQKDTPEILFTCAQEVGRPFPAANSRAAVPGRHFIIRTNSIVLRPAKKLAGGD